MPVGLVFCWLVGLAASPNGHAGPAATTAHRDSGIAAPLWGTNPGFRTAEAWAGLASVRSAARDRYGVAELHRWRNRNPRL